ncbi:MAG: hypothetical protein M1825_005385 [Sarcosagium campestre]|nr:MAG: hypothetical protein M1825_005385 [Sarcosagium campestre]
MPNRYPKSRIEAFDPTKSDSEDENYDEKPQRVKTSKPSRSGTKKSLKRKRRNQNSDESDDIETDSDEAEESFEEDEEPRVEEPVEIDPNTGRPRRSVTKKPVVYEEDSDSDELAESPPAEEPPPKKTKKSQVVTLKLNNPKRPPPVATGRSSRANSAPRGRRKGSSEPLSAGLTRRSSRLHHDENDPIIALSGSGKHAEYVERGTRSPEAPPIRLTRGGKGLKKPTTSDVLEESEPPTQASRSRLDSDDENGPDPLASITVAKDVPEVEDSDDGRAAPPKLADDDDDHDDDVDAMQADVDDDGAPAAGKRIPKPDVGLEGGDEDEGDDEDEGPISRGRRSNAKVGPRDIDRPSVTMNQANHITLRKDTAETAGTRGGRTLRQRHKSAKDPSSDFEFNPEDGNEEDVSSSEASQSSPKKPGQKEDDDEEEDDSNTRRSGRNRNRSRAGKSGSDEHDSEEAVELAEELQELHSNRPRRTTRTNDIVYDTAPKLRNRKKQVDYRIMRPELFAPDDIDPAPAATPSRRRGGGGGSWQRSLFSTFGPFGGAGGPPPILGGPGGIGAAAGADSDSSDDDRGYRPSGLGGTVGMTPTSAVAPGLFPATQAHGADPAQGPLGTPANLGKVKDRKALADADPLGVDQNVSFDSVGGLQGHINQLKEMVSLPLLYPEIFQRFHVTPPRGVLFHGPPGTGKTLLARALAASVSSEGRKITFYMRKGADALSKWVGEAERQLRLLFEEARTNQPSIIFFDEIDGLAPVRSSKQEQIHASIVSTLLALMDGMDGRGQVIVIGATNRPDSVDPALRRPGRFDREFYFPLPGLEARRSILDIHTKDWTPGLDASFKDQLAELTKGYGGADLRALCTEAALNAVQRRYPQIYTSNEKLKIDPMSITITAKDFMISVKKIVPSSERSSSSGATPLPKGIEPLLRDPLANIQKVIAEIMPQRKNLTALEEAQFEDFPDNDGGFQRERLQQDFETSRVFRPRLLIRGTPGMGQQYLAGALLNHFEGLHVQSFDLPVLLSDSTRSMEAAVVQLFAEVRRHKPSVIYIPNVDSWYRSVGSTVISTFLGLLRGLAPTEPVLLLAVLENEPDEMEKTMLRDLFGYSRRNQFELERPTAARRREYFETATNYIRKAPSDFPDPTNRKRRKIEELEVAPPPPPPAPPSKAEKQAQKKRDRQTLNCLKIRIQPVMDQIKLRYRKFRSGVIEFEQIRYLFDEENPTLVTGDARAGFRPFEKAVDRDGVPGLLEVASGKFFYNLDIVIIEERLSNGYYKRPKDFLADIRTLAKDAKSIGDRDRTLKANELLANVEVDMAAAEQDPALADCENVALRELQRIKERAEKHGKSKKLDDINVNLEAVSNSDPTNASSGPVQLGEPVPRMIVSHPQTPTRPSQHSSLSNGVTAEPQQAGESGDHTSMSNGDVHMTDADEAEPSTANGQPDSAAERAGAAPHTQDWGMPPSQRDRSAGFTPSQGQTQRSQKSALTAMPPGSNVEDFVNDASTTTSGKKTTESNPSSDPWKTESSNGTGSSGRKDIPDYRVDLKAVGDSQLPNTQGISSSGGTASKGPSRAGSQQSALPHPGAHSRPKQTTNLVDILNKSPPPEESSQYVVDHGFIDGLHTEFTERSSGCSIEQLEQVNTALMDCIWKMREEPNRTVVGHEVISIFNEIMSDIETMQEILPASLASR